MRATARAATFRSRLVLQKKRDLGPSLLNFQFTNARCRLLGFFDEVQQGQGYYYVHEI